MESNISFDPKFKFPTKASMKPDKKVKKIQILSNHFKEQNNMINLQFHEWFVSFIRQDQLKAYQHDHLSVKTDAVGSDSRYLISVIWRKNRPEIDKKIGKHLLTGVTLYSLEKAEDERHVFTNHSEYVMILELKNSTSGREKLLVGENKAEFLRFINSNLKAKLAENKFVEIGYNKKYYNKGWTQRVNTGDFSYLIYCGYKTAYDIYEGGLRLLIDYNTRIIHESSVWDDVQYYRKTKKMDDKEIIERYIIGRSVWTTYGSQKSYRIDEVETTKSIKSPFPNPEFSSYADYFLKKYKIQLKNPDQFLLVHIETVYVKDHTGKVINEIKNRTLFPAEIVRSTGIPEEERGNYQVMKAFAQYTCLPPDERFKHIDELIQSLNKTQNVIRNGVAIDPMRMRIEGTSNQVVGKSMPKPRIMHSKQNGAIPSKDRIEVKSLYEATPLDNWVLVYEPHMEKNLDTVIDNLISSAKRFQIEMGNPSQVVILPKSGKAIDLESEFARKKGFKRPAIIFFLIGKRFASKIYKDMKTHFNKENIPLQFFVSFNQNKDIKPNSKYSNLVLQMINKLGCNLWCVDRTLAQGLVLGVTSANGSKGMSIISTASQYSTNFSKIFSTGKLIPSQKKPDVGGSVADSVKEHIANYVKINGKLPKNIVLYRQGASEGQINEIVKDEIQKVVDGLQTAFGGQRPLVMFVVVTKKIDDRFAVFTGGRLQNPDCGLVVEDEVVKPDYANFLMVAQFVNQGSANPTHYAIVYNETDITFGELQGLTFDLCWAYTNWMGPIKIPSPLQYANKLCALLSITMSGQIGDKIKQTPYFL